MQDHDKRPPIPNRHRPYMGRRYRSGRVHGHVGAVHPIRRRPDMPMARGPDNSVLQIQD